MSSVTTINLRETVQFLEAIPANTFKTAKREIAKSLLAADEDIKTNTDLMRRTGQLFDSIQTRVEGTNLQNLEASIFTDSIYATTHEHGATIKAKDKYMGVPGGPFLNIPGKANLTPAGIMRKNAKAVFDEGGHIIGRTVHNADYTMLMFYLVKQVKIPARLHMVKSAEDQIPTMLSRIADQIGEG